MERTVPCHGGTTSRAVRAAVAHFRTAPGVTVTGTLLARSSATANAVDPATDGACFSDDSREDEMMIDLRSMVLVAGLAGLGGTLTRETDGAPQPRRILLRGEFATEVVEATLVRSGDHAWEWRERQAVFHFRSLTESAEGLLLHDASRDMRHRLSFKSRQSEWRIGATGEWNPHYTIIAVE
jgi:hypothetical protein